MTLTTFTRRENSDTWHFHRGCTKRPKKRIGVEVVTKRAPRSKPPTGELCDECQAKEKRDHNRRYR